MVNSDFNKQEVEQFSKYSEQWWDDSGVFKALHLVNVTRMRYIEERIHLNGLRILDVGCGGGLLCEALARRGAHVTGIDADDRAIEVAKIHAQKMNLDIHYQVGSAESLREHKSQYDLITCMELLEHVDAPEKVLASFPYMLNPKGSVILSSINRSIYSYFLAIVMAEHVLNLIPKGTHRYEKLLRPSELASVCYQHGMQITDLAGIRFNPFLNICALVRKPRVNYIMTAKLCG